MTKRVQDFLAGKGRKIIGWDEILEGDLAPGATVMSWRGTKGGIEASAKGFDVIMTPNTYCYFDYGQTTDLESEPLSIIGNNAARAVTLEKVYGYDPADGLDASRLRATPQIVLHDLGREGRKRLPDLPHREHEP